MKAVRRFVDRIKGEAPERPTSPANALPVVQTSEVTIPPASSDILDEELKGWADEADVGLDSVDGVWWRYGDLDGALALAREGKGLVGLQLHGGGYLVGSAKDVMSGGSRIPRGFIEQGVCSCLLSVEYSLVGQRDDEPEHPFPTQLLEALSAYRHIVQTLNVPSKHVILIGDSAGGHLALALQRYLLQSNVLPSPGGLILLSPWCDLSVESHIPHVKRLLGPRATGQLSTPYFSPALHPPPPQWPPMLVYYGKFERFVASISMLVSLFTNAGARVTSYAAEEIPERFSHDFLIMVSVERAWPKEVRKCWKRIKAWTKPLEAA
ncbi:alpha/beta-hydrolase [Dichomitus squalens]|uniref:Alpha/beta-hydrolase n=1 Tax=Dichomitus squalens TaxID=114155 RepID=A0A4Q9Q667_9APHY|nr:alpha/beta-hydrolase [Dichomitus squalens]